VRRSVPVALGRVDFKNYAIHLHDTKNGSARAVPLTMQAEEVLKSLTRSINQNALVFFGLSYEGLKQAFERALKRARICDFRLHDLRHEAASRAAETGQLSITELQAVTGHKDPRMIARYVHMLPGGKFQASCRLSVAFMPLF